MFGAIVIADKVDGVLIKIADHFDRKAVHSGLGVTHSSGFVAVDGTEVTMTVDKGVTHREWLGHTDEGAVKGGVAVWVIFTHDVTNDTSALLIWFTRLHA